MGAMLMKIVILLKENESHIIKKITNVRKMLIRNFENFHEIFYGGDVNQNRNFIEGK